MDELDVTELEFAGHEIHVLEDVAPTASEYESAAQAVHTTLPLLVLYVPAKHAEHTPLDMSTPPNSWYPALHEQALMLELDAAAPEFEGQDKHVDRALAPTVTEYAPVAQSVHAALPVLVLYLPASHVEHTPPSGPENPALQMQAPTTELELGEFEFVGQVKHTDAALAPTVPE